MLGDNFYFESLKKYNIAFGSLFTASGGIKVFRKDEHDFVVPVYYGRKGKIAQKIIASARSEAISITLPAISYSMVSMSPNMDAGLNKLNEVTITEYYEADLADYFIRAPRPWDIQYEVTLWTNTHSDLFQILEQITPFFTPEYTLSLNLMPEFGVKKDVPIILNDVGLELLDESDESAYQISKHQATLQFTLKGWLFPPIRDVKLIELIRVKTIQVPEIDSITQTTSNIITVFDE